MTLARRHFLAAIPGLLAAPAIVKAESIMPISVPWLSFDTAVDAIFRQNKGHDLWYHVRYPDITRDLIPDLSLAREAKIIVAGPAWPNCYAAASWVNPDRNVPPPLYEGQVVARGRRLGRVPINDWYLTDFTSEMSTRNDRGVWHRCWEFRLV